MDEEEIAQAYAEKRCVSIHRVRYAIKVLIVLGDGIPLDDEDGIISAAQVAAIDTFLTAEDEK